MSNLFAAQQIIISKIKNSVAGFVIVSNPSVIAGLEHMGGMLPACIVAPSTATLDSQVERSSHGVEEQTWDVVIILAHQKGDGATEQLASDLMTGVINALSNLDLGAGFVRPLKYAGRPEKPAYATNYAEFSLAFSVKKIVGM
jgi:hypothetical protein